jgi:hypothetical protein
LGYVFLSSAQLRKDFEGAAFAVVEIEIKLKVVSSRKQNFNLLVRLITEDYLCQPFTNSPIENTSETALAYGATVAPFRPATDTHCLRFK